MEQHTYSFPKVTPCDPGELREGLRASRRSLDVGGERRSTTRDDAQRRDAPAVRERRD